jgi:predicted HicB family RNase H-like nuclease
MASGLLKFGEYRASVEFDSDEMLLIGRVLDIDSLIMFSAEDGKQLQQEFEGAVTLYVRDCEARGVAPQRPYKGTFNVRVGPAVHRQAVEAARESNENLNEFVTEAIKQRIEARKIAKADHDFVVRSAQWEGTVDWSITEGDIGSDEVLRQFDVQVESRVTH